MCRRSLGTLRTNIVFVLSRDVAVSDPLCVSSTEQLEEEHFLELRRVLHSLATRVPKVILKRIECTFPVLKNRAVSVKHSVMINLILDWCILLR
jgi:hypothetical protein